jgi:hypothetical protein
VAMPCERPLLSHRAAPTSAPRCRACMRSAALMLTAFPASAVRVVIVPGMGAVSVDHVFW